MARALTGRYAVSARKAALVNTKIPFRLDFDIEKFNAGKLLSICRCDRAGSSLSQNNMKLNLKTQSITAGAWRGVLSAHLIVAFGCGLPAAVHAQTNCQPLISFGSWNVPSSSPNSLIEGSDGRLFGTTYSGGDSGRGTVFKLNKDGSGFTMLHSFTGGDDGGNPQAALVEGSDRVLYGTASQGGTSGGGTVFKLNRAGSGYKTLRSFDRNGHDGSDPLAGMIEGSDGALYGTTYIEGTVFKLNRDGSGFKVLHAFTGRDGSGPFAGLVLGSDGVLYGTTSGGGDKNGGTVFKLNQDGSNYMVLHSFNSKAEEGREPNAALVEGSDQALYGTTSKGDINVGAVFKLKKDGSGFTVLHRFNSPTNFNGSDGMLPMAGLAVGKDEALYGTTSAGGGGFGGGTVFKIKPDGSGYTVLHRFTGFPKDGMSPQGPALLRSGDGAMYGTTIGGGTKDVGIVFKLTLSGSRAPTSPAAK